MTVRLRTGRSNEPDRLSGEYKREASRNRSYIGDADIDCTALAVRNAGILIARGTAPEALAKMIPEVCRYCGEPRRQGAHRTLTETCGGPSCRAKLGATRHEPDRGLRISEGAPAILRRGPSPADRRGPAQSAA